MATLFRIVFSGRIRDGLTLASVRQAVEARLSANSAQVDRIFSGRKVVLKNGLEEAAARAYAARLERLGMVVRVEPVPDVTVIKAPEPAVASAPDLVASKAAGQEETWLTSSGFADLARTQVNLARAEALLNGQPEVPAIAPEAPARPLRTPEPPLPRLFGAPPVAAQPVVEVVPKVVKLPTLPVAPEPALPANTLQLSGTFRYNHCDALHQFEATVQVRLSDAEKARHERAS